MLEHFGAVKLEIGTLALQQLLVGADFHEASAVQNGDPIGLLDRGQPVRDDKHRAALHQRVHRGLNQRLALVVQGARRLVEDQDFRILQNAACNGDALPLPAGKRNASLADLPRKAARHFLDKLEGVGEVGGADHVLHRRLRTPVADVFLDGAREEEVFLENDAEVLAVGVVFEPPQVNAVNEDAPRGDIVKTCQQAHDRRFAASARPDQRNHLAGLYVEGEIAHGRTVGIGKTHLLELDAPRDFRRRHGVVVLANVRLRVEEREDALKAGAGVGAGLDQGGQASDGPEEHPQVGGVGHVVADGHLAADDAHSLHHHDDGVHQKENDADRALHLRAENRQCELAVKVVLDRQHKPPPLVILLGERLDDAHAGEGFPEASGKDGLALLHFVVFHAQFFSEKVDDHKIDGQRGRAEEREPPVQKRHDAQGDRHRDEGVGNRGEGGVDELLDRLRIVDDPVHQAPRLLFLIERKVQELEVVKQGAPYVEHRALADVVDEKVVAVGDDEADKLEHEQRKRQPDEEARVFSRYGLVNDDF